MPFLDNAQTFLSRSNPYTSKAQEQRRRAFWFSSKSFSFVFSLCALFSTIWINTAASTAHAQGYLQNYDGKTNGDVAAWPQPSCIENGLKTTCGYHCVNAGLESKCAQTPLGVCHVNGLKITCFDPPASLFQVPPQAILNLQTLPKATCLDSGLNTACGYFCQKNGLDVKCAKTPYGACSVSASDVVCFDPPFSVIAQGRNPSLQAQCLVNGLRVACGYSCQKVGIDVACAKTPYGACAVAGVNIVCYDPPAEVLQDAQQFNNLPRASCIEFNGGAVCGYGCQKTRMMARCAQSPTGTCVPIEMTGQVVCYDPNGDDNERNNDN